MSTAVVTGPLSDEPSEASRDLPVLTWRAAYKVAALFVLPYLILMLAWSFSNPPGAAPDESDHLIKAVSVASGSLGTQFPAKDIPADARPIISRNLSVSRIVPFPSELYPAGYTCTHRNPKPANCLPKTLPKGGRTLHLKTAMGAYPPFLYPPMGLAAKLMDTPTRAFLAGRVVCDAMAAVLLFFGVGLLVRWLGRRALLGAFIGLTPMALFSSAMMSLSGAEICAAFATACVGVVAIRRPAALASNGVMYTLAGVGATLILSRQLGSVTCAAVVLLALARVGRMGLRTLLRRRDFAFFFTVAALLASGLAIIWWEHGYDNPNQVGPALSTKPYPSFIENAFVYIRGGVGLFGWLDTPMPRWTVVLWVLLVVTVIGIAVLMGSAADRWSLIGWLVVLVIITYVTYATVFYPIRANLQARHLLPFFQFAPLLAGVVVVETLEVSREDVLRRLFRLVAVVMPVIQVVGLYINARRYAVGVNGPLWFAGHSKWAPKLGWTPWLAMGLVGAALLGYVVLRSYEPLRRRTRAHVER